MDYKDSFLYRGLVIEVKAKQEFVLKTLEIDELRTKIAKMIYDESQIKHTSNCKELGGGLAAVQIALKQQELERIYDKLIKKKFRGTASQAQSEEDQMMLEIWEKLLSQNGTTKYLDVTNYLTYAVLESEACIRQLRVEIEKSGIYDELYSAFEQSVYKKQGFETLVDARLISESRLFRGLLVKFRQDLTTELYQMIMRILYAGYRKIKKELKRLDVLGGEEMRTIQKPWSQSHHSPLFTSGVHMVIYVMANDLNVDVYWDFELLILASVVEQYEKTLLGKEFEEDAAEALTESQRQFLEKAEEKFGTTNSMSELIYGGKADSYYLHEIMQLYHISGRKFTNYALTDEEVSSLLLKREKWNTKDFMYCLIMACMCKYIASIEKVLMEVDVYRATMMNKQIKLGKEEISKQEEILRSKEAKWKEKEQELKKELFEKERQVNQFSKQMIEQKEQLADYEQELGELRSYVYSLHEQWEEQKFLDNRESENFWRSKRVLVVGGHSNWQKKLKERFPKWQFLSAETKNMTTDLIREKEYIVCNTELLSHGTYYKLLALRKREQRIFYVHSNNMELCLRELNLQRGM